MKSIALLLLAAISLIAADASGRWTGTLTPEGQQPGPALVLLKQDGSRLTGTAGPNANDQHPIQNGKVEDGKITFDVPRGERVMKFKLKLDGDEMKGDVTRERDGQTDRAKLHVKRNR